MLTFICAAFGASAADLEPLSFPLPGGELSVPRGEAPLFELYTTASSWDNRARALTDSDFQHVNRSSDGRVTTLTFTGSPDEWGGGITVTIRYEDAGCEVLTNLAVKSDSYLPIRLVRYPVVDTPQVRRYDTMLLPHNCGDAMDDPLIMIGNRLGGRFSWRYPGESAMQYMVFYNNFTSYYLSAYSTGDECFDHMVRTKGKSLRLSLDWYPFLDNGGEWQTPQCSLSVLGGGWHEAADLYQSHMSSVFQPPDLPEWMKESFHGWVQYGMKGSDDTGNKFSQLPYIYKSYVEDIGFNTLHIFSWCVDGLDHHFPDRNPSPYLGEPEDLTKAVDTIRRMGGQIDLYTNGRSVDIDSDFYRGGGDKSLVRTEYGGMYFEGVPTYMPKSCPYSTLYQDAMLDAFKLISEKYHASGAQIDQVSCSPPIFCFDQSHGHRSSSANWNTGVDTMLKRIHDYYTSRDPDFFVWIEGTNERFGQYYEVHQSHGESHGWTAGLSVPEQFKYTYPDHLTMGLCDTIDELIQTYGQGKPFDFRINRVFRPEIGTLMRKLLSVRKSEPEYFLHGIFKDGAGLVSSAKDVKCWRIDDRDGGGMLINLWGRGRDVTDECEAWIKIPDGLTSIREIYPTNLDADSDGAWCRLTWGGPVATVAFEKPTD